MWVVLIFSLHTSGGRWVARESSCDKVEAVQVPKRLSSMSKAKEGGRGKRGK